MTPPPKKKAKNDPIRTEVHKQVSKKFLNLIPTHENSHEGPKKGQKIKINFLFKFSLEMQTRRYDTTSTTNVDSFLCVAYNQSINSRLFKGQPFRVLSMLQSCVLLIITQAPKTKYDIQRRSKELRITKTKHYNEGKHMEL